MKIELTKEEAEEVYYALADWTCRNKNIYEKDMLKKLKKVEKKLKKGGEI